MGSGLLKAALVLAISVATTGPASASSFSKMAADHVKETCSQSIVIDPHPTGDNYFVIPTSMAKYEDRIATALDVFHEGRFLTKLSILYKDHAKEYFIPRFNYKRILLTENAVWFLTPDSLREFSLMEGKIINSFPSYPQEIEQHQTTSARGFTYQSGFIYIAHGDLGVVIFDAKNRKHYTVLKKGLQPASMAAAVQVRGNHLYILQGAYLPQGFNGVAVVDMRNGSAKHIAYPKSSGVVDPYSSSMALTDNQLVINNGGWIHSYKISDLQSGKSPLAPSWTSLLEKVHTEGGTLDRYLMIAGDFVVVDKMLMACSSVTYIPPQKKKPVREWRFIHTDI